MANQLSVEAEVRNGKGKGMARRLRREGKIPAVLYGARKEPIALAVNPKQVGQILHSSSGHNTIFQLAVRDGEKTAVMIVDWQREPVLGKLLHVDLKRIAMDVRIRVKVPVHTVGEAAGVRLQSGILELVTREIDIECLPSEIPDSVTVDVSELNIGQNLRVGDLKLGDQLRILTDSERVIAHVVAVKEIEVAAAPVEGAEVAPAEPEVIKKGKAETAEEPAAEAKPAKEREKEKK
jgi:large subunit ribosomal protein L25